MQRSNKGKAAILLLLLLMLAGAGGEPTPKGPGGLKTPPKGPDKPPVNPGGPTGPKGDPQNPIEPKDIPPPAVACPPGQHFDEARGCVPDGPTGPEDPGPADIDSLVKDYATPNTFVPTKKGTKWLGEGGIATRYASSALYVAAQTHGGLDHDAALAWASSGGRNGAAAQLELTKLAACAPINDVRFGTYAYVQGSDVPGPQGRAIRILAINGDDRARIRAGETMIRNVRLGAPGDPPSVSAAGVANFHSYPLVWLPGIDLKVLWDSDGRTWQVGGTWSDGSSKIHPPPKIYDLGVTDYSNSNLNVWGCAPWTADMERD